MELGIDRGDLEQAVNSTEFIYGSLCQIISSYLNRKPIDRFVFNLTTVPPATPLRISKPNRYVPIHKNATNVS